MIVLTDLWPTSLAAYRGILARCLEAFARTLPVEQVRGEGVCLARGENAAVLDACYAFLKPTRSPRTLFDLRYLFMGKAYLLFTEEDLRQALLADGRFSVSHGAGLTEVSVVRTQRTKNKCT